MQHARIAQISVKTYARAAGMLYLVTMITGIFTQAIVKAKIIVAGDVAATAANLRSMESLWHLGIVSEMTMILSAVVLSLCMYALLRPLHKDLARLATAFGMLTVTVEAAYPLQLFQALLPLGTAEYLKAFTPEQLNAVVRLPLRSHDIGFAICMFLFGPFFLVGGYLIYCSTYFPRAIGVLYQVAGVAYLALGFGQMLAPALAAAIFSVIVLPAFVGEASFCLWLLFRCADASKRNAAHASDEREPGDSRCRGTGAIRAG